MKYIDADLLRAEIERLRDEYTDIAIDSHYGTVNANHVVDDLEQLLSILDTLPEQPAEGLERSDEKIRDAEVILNGHGLLIDVTKWADGYKLKVIVKDE